MHTNDVCEQISRLAGANEHQAFLNLCWRTEDRFYHQFSGKPVLYRNVRVRHVLDQVIIRKTLATTTARSARESAATLMRFSSSANGPFAGDTPSHSCRSSTLSRCACADAARRAAVCFSWSTHSETAALRRSVVLPLPDCGCPELKTWRKTSGQRLFGSDSDPPVLTESTPRVVVGWKSCPKFSDSTRKTERRSHAC
jgi:hypothetical protein